MPPERARAFLLDMRAYFRATTELQRDEIAARQLHVLSDHLRPGDKKLRISDVRELFERMADEIGK